MDEQQSGRQEGSVRHVVQNDIVLQFQYGKMRASGLSKRILFCEHNKFSKCLANVYSSYSCRYGYQVLLQHEDQVARKKYYSTKEEKSKPKITYNSLYKYGLPHETSNIPSVEFNRKQNETKKEKAFREHKQDLMKWHHTFWLQQNEKFNKEKKEYLQRRESTTKITDGKEHADDLSLFYKDFLDKNFHVHFKYQREWYKKNVILTWYGLQVGMGKLFKRLMGKWTTSKNGS